MEIKHKTCFLLIIFMLACLPVLHAESAMESFIKKAGIAKNDIEVSSGKLEKLKMIYAETEGKIQELKNRKEQGGIKGFFNGIALKIYLSKGNRFGYKIYALENGIRALKEDYFTYVSLITEEYGSQIRKCSEKKCPGLKELCDKRREWMDAVEKYGFVLHIDLSSMKLIKDYSPGAANDVKDYLQKKIIQAEQRIYMLEEEKEIIDIMKKAGLGTSGEKQKNAEKISALKKLKKELQMEINKIK